MLKAKEKTSCVGYTNEEVAYLESALGKYDKDIGELKIAREILAHFNANFTNKRKAQSLAARLWRLRNPGYTRPDGRAGYRKTKTKESFIMVEGLRFDSLTDVRGLYEKLGRSLRKMGF